MEFKSIDTLNIAECCEQLDLKIKDLPEALQAIIEPDERELLLIEQLQSLLMRDKAAVDSCNTIEEYQNYISIWSDGLYHSYARHRISQLKADAEELDFYEKNKYSILGCEAYLRKYPKGKWAKDAQALLIKKKRIKRNRILICIVLLLIGAGICVYSNYEPVTYLYADKEPVLSNSGSEISLYISTDAIDSMISVEGSEDWVSCRVSGDTLYISAIENPNTERNAKITITAYSSLFKQKLSDKKQIELSVSQNTGHAKYLSLSNYEARTSYTAGTSIISIKTDGICEISESPESWLTASINGKSLILKYGENPDEVRDTYLTITSGTKSQKLKFTQAGKRALFLEPSHTDISFPYTGGTTTITISTDGLWEIGAEPKKWVKLSTSHDKITLSVDEYNGESKRDDYFTIRSGSLEKRIYVTQAPDNVPRAIVNKVWVDHNQPRTGFNKVYDNYWGIYRDVPYNYYAIVIHVDLEVINKKGKEIYVCAFFYDENGNMMQGPDSRYKTRDGQTTIQSTSTPRYRNSYWEDYKLEIPISAISIGHNKFYIEIKDKNGNCIGSSDYVYFSRDS